MAGSMTRREFIAGSAVAAAGAMMPGSASGTKERPPNVVIVMSDDQGCGDLGCHGHPYLKTPNLDGLHAESVRFTDFHACPTCAPTRASLLTGRYSNRTGVWHTVLGRSLLRSDETTMADVFRKHGYCTGIFGKWHLGDNYPYRPQDRGFEECLIHGGGGIGQIPDYWGNDYFGDTYQRNGGFERFDGYCTDVFFEAAVAFIEEHRNSPFFCYIPTNAAHAPFRVEEKYRESYRNLAPSLAAFYGMLANLDENVGKLLSHIEALGLGENTILVFTTDNGSANGHRRAPVHNAGLRGLKGSIYEGGHRVPCFVRWPGGNLRAGSDIATLTANIDLLPTLADLCRVPLAKETALDGRNLAPMLRGDEAEIENRTIVVDSQRIDHPEKWRQCAVMTQHWRLIDGKELYDLRTDRGQKRDIAAEHPDVVARLRQDYEAWWSSVSKRFDEYCNIPIGPDSAPVTHLNCHDWHRPEITLHDQPEFLAGKEWNGFWAIAVPQGGEYCFELRRWPVELPMAMTGAPEGGIALPIQEARIEVGGKTASASVEPGAESVRFILPLDPGPTRLRTWLLDGSEGERGAYYTIVSRAESLA